MGRDNPAAELAEKVNALMNGDPEEPDTPAADDAPEPAPPEETPAGDEPKAEGLIEIDGEKYTLDQLREFRQGHLRQDDYTRKAQMLAAERKALDSERGAARDLLDRYSKVLESLVKPGQETDEGDDYELAPGVKKLLGKRDATIQKLETAIQEIRTGLQTREEEAEVKAANDEIVRVGFGAIREQMKAKNIPDDLFDLFRDAIGMKNPDVVDPISGRITEASIKAAVLRTFNEVYGPLAKHFRPAVADPKLKKEPPAKAAAPGKPPAKKPDEKPKLERPGWDSQEAIDEMVQRVSTARGAGGYTP